jgi:hypothetical protein
VLTGVRSSLPNTSSTRCRSWSTSADVTGIGRGYRLETWLLRGANRLLVVDVRIGVTYSPRDIELELPDDADQKAVRGDVEAALAGGDGAVLWLTDKRGRQVGVPADKIAFVDLGVEGAERRIGFGGV